jgi:hypothetical protein
MHEYFLELSKQSIMGKDGSVLGCMEVQTILVRPVIMDIPTMKRALSVKLLPVHLDLPPIVGNVYSGSAKLEQNLEPRDVSVQLQPLNVAQ